MTDLIEEIRAALLLANPNDLDNFERYLHWLGIRRRVNDRFYFSAHWVKTQKTPGYVSQASKPLLVSSTRRAHWL